ncbi:MAG: hypothetical protein AAF149_25080 [Bacteroidota bacterium]
MVVYYCWFGYNGVSNLPDDWAKFGSYLAGTYGFVTILAILINTWLQEYSASEKEKQNKTFQMLERWNQQDLRKKRICFYNVFKEEGKRIKGVIEGWNKDSRKPVSNEQKIFYKKIKVNKLTTTTLYSFLTNEEKERQKEDKNWSIERLSSASKLNFDAAYKKINNPEDPREDRYKFNEIGIFFSDLYDLLKAEILDNDLSYKLFARDFEAWSHLFVYINHCSLKEYDIDEIIKTEHRKEWINQRVLPLGKLYRDIEKELKIPEEEALFDETETTNF